MAKFKLKGEGGILAKIGRKNLIIIAAVLLIGAAVAVNYFAFYGTNDKIDYGNSDMGDGGTNAGADAGGDGSGDSYFSAAVLSRQQAREEALEVLQTVLSSEDALEETKAQALADISRIALEIEKDSNIETLVRAKGFEECVAVISGEAASIIVKGEGDILAGHVAQIGEIVYEQTGILPVNFKILSK